MSRPATTLEDRPAQGRPAGTMPTTLRLALPKGRMHDGVCALLADAGLRLRTSARGYRPTLGTAGFETKILKPQNIVEMLHLGSRDVGFAGADWVAELDADIVEVLDTGLDQVRLVAAAPRARLDAGGLAPSPDGPLRIASEYQRLTTSWIAERGLDARVVRSYGATEVLPPEDADAIVDITASGATLEANGLEIFDEILTSSTRLYASKAAIADDAKRAAIEDLALVLQAALDARLRVMLEVNAPQHALEAIAEALPCMREPTVSPLHGGAGWAVKAAVPREALARLIPLLKARGGTDIVVTRLEQVAP
ncbi:MAG: ATP phosphoribosyltransferase [Phycisphaerales bacterium JB039]